MALSRNRLGPEIGLVSTASRFLDFAIGHLHWLRNLLFSRHIGLLFVVVVSNEGSDVVLDYDDYV